jgi:hypothetical protein
MMITVVLCRDDIKQGNGKEDWPRFSQSQTDKKPCGACGNESIIFTLTCAKNVNKHLYTYSGNMAIKQ